jgi:antitoxin component YwqK of YwqJK toxin-antitoxin module
MIRATLLFILILGLAACTKTAHRPSSDVTYQGNYLLYKGDRFTGILEEKFEQVETVRKSRFKDGLQDGIEEEFFKTGQLVARREYTNGVKNGIHEGWFNDGKKRFHHEFKNNQSHGEFWEWHNSGALAMYARFKDGQLLGKKMWRESGQIYMNYVFPNNQAIGIPGAKLCYQVRGT